MKVDRNKLEMIQAKLNLTSKELIQKTGISSTTYCKIKANKSVSPLVVGKIARALDCEVETLAKKEWKEKRKWNFSRAFHLQKESNEFRKS